MLKRKQLQELAQQRKETKLKAEAAAAQQQRLLKQCIEDIADELVLEVVSDEGPSICELRLQEDERRLEKLERFQE